MRYPASEKLEIIRLVEPSHLPGDLEAQIAAFVERYNHRRFHESLGNLTPADVYTGRGPAILLQREKIKRDTIHQRRLLPGVAMSIFDDLLCIADDTIDGLAAEPLR